MKRGVSCFPLCLTMAILAFGEQEYRVNYMMYPEGTPGVNRATSKHFCVVYGDHDKKGLWSKEMAEGTLRNLEALWTVYVEKLQWTPPSECRDPGDHLIEVNCEGLKPGTTYFVRAFAKNALGEKWAGRTLRFKALAPSREPKNLKK